LGKKIQSSRRNIIVSVDEGLNKMSKLPICFSIPLKIMLKNDEDVITKAALLAKSSKFF
jgi:hypothetical protein